MTRDFKINPTVNGDPVVVNTELTIASIEHGGDPNVSRPDYPMVIWHGTVEPNNWTDNDIWHDKS